MKHFLEILSGNSSRNSMDTYEQASPGLSYLDADHPVLKQRGLQGTVNTNIILSPHQSFVIRVLVASASGVTMVSSLVTLYWLFRMRKNFRHRLIMLLILSDLFKTIWYFIFPIVVFTRGSVPTKSLFCQASGFLTLAGTQATDFVILCIAIHTMLHVFQPAVSVSGEEGLYRYKFVVYGLSVALPTLLAALAFINPVAGYMSQGVTCTLPVRPFWYRLALAWVPRYCIFFAILGIYAALNIHVASIFRAFKRVNAAAESSSGCWTSQPDDSVSLSANNEDLVHPDETNPEQPAASRGIPDNLDGSMHALTQVPRKFSAATTLVNAGARRRSSIQPTLSGVEAHPAPSKSGIPMEQRIVEDFAAYASAHRFPFDGREKSVDPTYDDVGLPEDHQVAHPVSKASNSSTKSISQLDGFPSFPVNAGERMRRRRAAIRSQLRLLFVYPIVYIAMWIVPFINHCRQYDDHYAQHPSYPLVALAFFCVSFMGTLDCAVFCLREKPWRHLYGSDGTFKGSFQFWRHNHGMKPIGFSSIRTRSSNFTAEEQGNYPPSIPAPALLLPVDYRSLGTPAERARERLQIEYEERAARRKSLELKRSQSFTNRGSRPREWFDQKSSILDASLGQLGEDSELREQ